MNSLTRESPGLSALREHYRDSRVLIFGGAGFIGSNMAETLLFLDAHVKVVDNLSTGHLENLNKLTALDNFEFSHGDVETYRFSGFDYIFNLACPASPEQYQKDPMKTFTSSVLGVMNLCGQVGSSRLLHASTSEIYGDPLEHPQRESYWGNVNPIGPRSCYDEGKRAAETYLNDFSKITGAEVIICRIFNTYGPKLNPNDGRVFSNFLKQAKSGAPMTIYGDGSQTRSLCYVDDLIFAMLRLLSLTKMPEIPINIGNDTEYTVLEIAHLIARATKSSSPLVFEQLPIDDPTKRRPDLTELNRLLNWKPQITLSDGIELCLNYEY